MTITFDTYAWIEFFSGTKKGERVKKYIDSSDMILTPAIAVFELSRKYLRQGKDPKKQVEYIKQRSKVIDLDFELATAAAKHAVNYKLATADAIVYATALANKITLLTCDERLCGLESVECLK